MENKIKFQVVKDEEYDIYKIHCSCLHDYDRYKTPKTEGLICDIENIEGVTLVLYDRYLVKARISPVFDQKKVIDNIISLISNKFLSNFEFISNAD